MAESIVQVTEGSGKKLHTWARTIGANTVEDEAVYPAEYPVPTYTVLGGSVIFTTAASHLLQVMAGASLHVRIRRITITQQVMAGAIADQRIQVFRLTTAGTGGTAVTARPFDTGDVAAGASGMTLPTAKGTEGTQLLDRSFILASAAIPTTGNRFEWIQAPNGKPIIIPAGAANGIAIKNVSGVATATCNIEVEFTETAYL
jgi:hypothetical protein